MAISTPPRSTCQKVQPLQLGAFCTAAPTWWIDPRSSPHTSVPSDATVARAAVDAFLDLMRGANTGKMLVRL